MTHTQEWPPGYRTELRAVVQGEFQVSKDPTVALSTVLGSCVAVCLYDTEAKVGGMNHYLLAEGARDDTNALRYGTNAMELLINALLKRGATRSLLRAKVFGGSQLSGRFGHIGRTNVEFALGFLSAEGLPIEGQDLGGTTARRVNFHPVTGRARCASINAPVDQIDKADLRAAAPPRPRASSVELF